MERRVVTTRLEDLSPVMTECMEAGSEIVLIVTGNSMRPFLASCRDQVVLKKCDATMLQIGDVPLYRRADGQFVLHRIVDIGASTYTMCGDAQTEKEYGVPNNRILAVAVGFYRKGKYVACTDFWYKVYVRLWMALRPVRPVLLKCMYAYKRVTAKLSKIFKKKA